MFTGCKKDTSWVRFSEIITESPWKTFRWQTSVVNFQNNERLPDEKMWWLIKAWLWNLVSFNGKDCQSSHSFLSSLLISDLVDKMASQRNVNRKILLQKFFPFFFKMRAQQESNTQQMTLRRESWHVEERSWEISIYLEASELLDCPFWKPLFLLPLEKWYVFSTILFMDLRSMT